MSTTSFGKYKLIAELGHGGMADVFLAVQSGPAGSGFHKLMVVKRLRRNLADEPEFVAMLVDEARIAARLNHPNVVQTNEVGELNGQYFIAMEYLDGQPLHRVQHRNTQGQKDGSPPVFGKELQYVILLDVLAGLHHAHELLDYDGTPLQIVHRDMTPHNIFVTYEGQVKVVDFGIARAAGRSAETRQGIIKGKVRYMAPEQAVGHNVDRRVDIFAIGIILWETASGRRMWKDKDDLQIVHALVGGDVQRSPRAIDPTVPEALDAICQKALAHRADDRYANAEEFHDALEKFLTDSGVLPQARRQIPASLNTLFKDKRAEIRAIIEAQLANLNAKNSDVSTVPLGTDSMSIPIELPALPDSMSSASTSRSLPGMRPDVLAGAPVSSRSGEVEGLSGQIKHSSGSIATGGRRRGRVLAALAGAALVAGIAVVAFAKFGLPKKPATTEPDQVSIRIMGSPSTALVRLDDAPAHPLPFTTSAPRDKNDHRLHLEADGYQTKDETISFAQDLVLSVDLSKNDVPAAPSSPPSGIASARPPPTPDHKLAHVPAGPPPGPGPAVHKTTATPTTTQPDPKPTAPPPTNTPPPPPPPTAEPAPPPPTPAAPAVDVAAEHKKAVNRTVRGHASEVQSCFDRARVASPQLAGVVAIGATLGANGSVSNARVANSTVRGAGQGGQLLENCLVERFRSWTFPPPPPGSSEISYTFKFE